MTDDTRSSTSGGRDVILVADPIHPAGIERLGEKIGGPFRRRFVGGKAENVGRIGSLVLAHGGHGLSTKLSTTRFSPAFSNATVSLLPSTSVTLP